MKPNGNPFLFSPMQYKRRHTVRTMRSERAMQNSNPNMGRKHMAHGGLCKQKRTVHSKGFYYTTTPTPIPQVKPFQQMKT